MIDKKDFYEPDESISPSVKKELWKNINSSITPQKEKSFWSFEYRSFAFGMAATVILFFTFIGVKSTVSNFIYENKSYNEKINNSYQEVIGSFEKTLPLILANKERSIKLDDILSEKTEELKVINYAINEFKDNSNSIENSPIKEERIRKLYRMKLEIINDIIELEEREL